MSDFGKGLVLGTVTAAGLYVDVLQKFHFFETHCHVTHSLKLKHLTQVCSDIGVQIQKVHFSLSLSLSKFCLLQTNSYTQYSYLKLHQKIKIIIIIIISITILSLSLSLSLQTNLYRYLKGSTQNPLSTTAKVAVNR